MITYNSTPETTTAAWRLRRSGDLFTIVRSNSEWFLAWNGPLFDALEVAEQPRLLGELREAKGRFAGDKRPEVVAFYGQFAAIVDAIIEGVQTR